LETQNSILIRSSEPKDVSGIQTLYLEAFETDEEATIFQELRHSNLELISLVAEEECQIRGHNFVQHGSA
jgi:predicted N-acetyltransferase YhbS